MSLEYLSSPKLVAEKAQQEKNLAWLVKELQPIIDSESALAENAANLLKITVTAEASTASSLLQFDSLAKAANHINTAESTSQRLIVIVVEGTINEPNEKARIIRPNTFVVGASEFNSNKQPAVLNLRKSLKLASTPSGLRGVTVNLATEKEYGSSVKTVNSYAVIDSSTLAGLQVSGFSATSETAKLTIVNSSLSGNKKGSGALIATSLPIQIENSKITDNAFNGLILLNQDISLTLNNVQIRGNGNGIDAEKASSILLENVTIEENRKKGVKLLAVSDVTIKYSTVSKNGDNGIFVNSVSKFNLANSSVESNTRTGINVQGFIPTFALSNANLNSNGGSGLYISTSIANVELESCNLNKNKWDGFHIVDSKAFEGTIRVSLKDCNISQNSAHGVFLNDIETTIKGCSIVDNEGHGVKGSKATLFENTVEGNKKDNLEDEDDDEEENETDYEHA